MGGSDLYFGGRRHWWVDVVVGVLIVWLGCMGMEAMATATTVRAMDETDQSLATAIARGEQDRIDGLAFGQLLPTGGFVAPGWIRNQDLAPGEIALVTQPDQGEVGESQQVYAVKWKVENVDRLGTIRRVTVSVEWHKPNQRPGRVLLTALRSGGHTA